MSGELQENLSRVSLETAAKDRVRSKRIRNLLTGVKIIAGLALLILALYGINYENLITGIRSAQLTWLLLAILAILIGLVLKLWRWAILLKNYHFSLSLSRLFSAYFVGQAANIVLPFRGGELVRLGYFAEERRLLPEAASTIILEKYLDLLALCICALLFSIGISLKTVVDLQSWIVPLTISVSLLLLAAILFGPALWHKIRVRRVLPERISSWLEAWVEASLWLRQPKQVLPAVAFTVLIWGVMWFTNLLVFNSLGLPWDGKAAGLVLILVYVGLFPALMPGNVGPFYFFARLSLLPFGIIQEQAVVFAVVLHAIVTLPPLLGGAIGLLLHSKPPTRA